MAREPIPSLEMMSEDHSPMLVRLLKDETIPEYCSYVRDLSEAFSHWVEPEHAEGYRHPLAISYFMLRGLPDCDAFTGLKDEFDDLLITNTDDYVVPNISAYYNIQEQRFNMTPEIMFHKIWEKYPEEGLEWDTEDAAAEIGRTRKRAELDYSTDDEYTPLTPRKKPKFDSASEDEDRPPNQRMRTKFTGYESEFEEEEDPSEDSRSDEDKEDAYWAAKVAAINHAAAWAERYDDDAMPMYKESALVEEERKDEEAKELQQEDGALTNTVATNQVENHMEQVQEVEHGANVARMGGLAPHIILLAINLCLTLGSFYCRFH